LVFLRICSLFFWLLFVLFEIIYKIRILFLMTFQFFHLSNLVLILLIAISFLFLDLFYFIFSFHPLLYYYYFYFYIILDPYFFISICFFFIIENFSSWFLWVCLLLWNLVSWPELSISKIGSIWVQFIFFFQFYHLTVGYWVFNLVIFVALCYMVLSQSHILDWEVVELTLIDSCFLLKKN